jgi:hypothetical protein
MRDQYWGLNNANPPDALEGPVRLAYYAEDPQHPGQMKWFKVLWTSSRTAERTDDPDDRSECTDVLEFVAETTYYQDWYEKINYIRAYCNDLRYEKGNGKCAPDTAPDRDCPWPFEDDEHYPDCQWPR